LINIISLTFLIPGLAYLRWYWSAACEQLLVYSSVATLLLC